MPIDKVSKWLSMLVSTHPSSVPCPKGKKMHRRVANIDLNEIAYHFYDRETKRSIAREVRRSVKVL